jgi:transcriptional regulator with XRE-family HTH domain
MCFCQIITRFFLLTALKFRISFLSMADFDDLYGEVGRKLRQARVTQGLSQERLAQQLGISRASVVNIEAGRQRAPLHLLWQFSEALATDLSLLIPRREELSPAAKEATLDPAMVKQIREAANNDSDAIKVLTRFASKLKATIEIDSPDRKAHDQRKTRRKS